MSDERVIPEIGQPWQGGTYAGVSVHENQPVHLVLLPGAADRTWTDAATWAKECGGELPSRIDALILFQNVNAHVKDHRYWTADICWNNCAWFQFGRDGEQKYELQDQRLDALAIRRIPFSEHQIIVKNKVAK